MVLYVMQHETYIGRTPSIGTYEQGQGYEVGASVDAEVFMRAKAHGPQPEVRGIPILLDIVGGGTANHCADVWGQGRT